MENAKLEAFRKAGESARSTDDTALDLDANAVFRGYAVHTDENTVAIKREDGTVLRFRESDVVDATQSGKAFLLKVRAGASAQLVQTHTFTVSDSDCDCESDDKGDWVPMRFKLPYEVEGEDFKFPSITVDGSNLLNCMTLPTVKVRKVPVATPDGGYAITRHVYIKYEEVCGAPWS